MTSGLPFGELLKRYRVAAGWTQEALAERARLSPRTISDLERGVTNWPYKETVALLATALALTPAQRAALEATRRRPTPSSDARQPDGSASPMSVGSLNPADGAAAPLSHLRTFLIADLRESTRFASERGEATAAELVARFEALVREGVAARDGQVIESRGNEVVVAFGLARQALRAALDLQERAARAGATEPHGPLPMGIGLDAGEAVPTEGGYRGGALNLAARLCGMAAPGEVLTSAGMMHLARRTPGLAYVERGELAEDGGDDPVRVIQALAENAEGMESVEGEAGVAVPDIGTAGRSIVEQRAARIDALYRAAQAAMAVENWADALERLRELLTLDPGYAAATALARRALQQQELPALYDKGRAHYDAGRWRAALDYFRQAQQIGGNYKGVFALMATAQYEIEREGARVNDGVPHGSSSAGTSRPSDPMDAHYRQVVKAFMDGRVVPFLGADINLCGRPICPGGRASPCRPTTSWPPTWRRASATSGARPPTWCGCHNMSPL